MTTFENRILHYMEAGFPILYLNTFEEGKAREAILSTFAGNLGRTTILGRHRPYLRYLHRRSSIRHNKLFTR